jgi:hypothetical protein
MNVDRLLLLSQEILSLPEVIIRMCGDSDAKNIFDGFTKPHPRYKLIQNKRWGVALLKLPNQFHDYIKGKDKQALRSNRRRAMDLGFRFDSFDPISHLDEILEINTSMEARQGIPMAVSYQTVECVKMWVKGKDALWGVFDGCGVLKAYAHVSICGEVFIFSRLLGHGQDLDKGIMYLLVSEIIRKMTEHKEEHGSPLWSMYDTFFGASPGLRYFKQRLGFSPYKVRWTWQAKN